MFRGLLKLLLIIVILVAAGAFLLGWWGSGGTLRTDVPIEVGPASEKARAAGSEVAEKAAQVADRTAAAAEVAREKTGKAAVRARKAFGEGSLTAKIKAKMALDDHVKALDLNVDTVGTVVTISGIVNNKAERDRALHLARDTAGVTRVVDKLQIRR